MASSPCRVSIPDGDSFRREVPPKYLIMYLREFQSPMGIVSSAKVCYICLGAISLQFQSPMGIVSSAKQRSAWGV